MTSRPERMPVLLDQLVAAQIDLVEWDQHLLSRLRVPIVTDTVSNLLSWALLHFPTCTRIYFS